MKKTILPRDFYLRPAEEVAPALLGQTLVVVHGRSERRLMIVETEAYLGLEDPAAHSFHGKRTERVRAMYEAGGHAYVYLIYGMYHCLNVVTGPAELPEAVLIRAGQEIDDDEKPIGNSRLLAGPGKLCRALGITRVDNGIDLTVGKRLWIECGIPVAFDRIHVDARIGVQGYGDAAEWPLRFSLREHPAVSIKNTE